MDIYKKIAFGIEVTNKELKDELWHLLKQKILINNRLENDYFIQGKYPFIFAMK